MNKQLLIIFDFDDSITNGHTTRDTEISLSGLKHPQRLAAAIAEALESGALFGIATESEFTDKIRHALSLMFEGDVSKIPIISKPCGQDGKNPHIKDIARYYEIREELCLPILFDDGTTNVEASLTEGWAGIVVPSGDNCEHDKEMVSHVVALETINANPAEVLEICAKHNASFSVYPPQRSRP